jgi:hypothetical protein
VVPREQGQLLETWIVMEYADRGNLADALRTGRFPCRDLTAVYRCLLDIAAGAILRLTSPVLPCIRPDGKALSHCNSHPWHPPLTMPTSLTGYTCHYSCHACESNQTA